MRTIVASKLGFTDLALAILHLLVLLLGHDRSVDQVLKCGERYDSSADTAEDQLSLSRSDTASWHLCLHHQEHSGTTAETCLGIH